MHGDANDGQYDDNDDDNDDDDEDKAGNDNRALYNFRWYRGVDDCWAHFQGQTTTLFWWWLMTDDYDDHCDCDYDDSDDDDEDDNWAIELCRILDDTKVRTTAGRR